MLSQKESVYVAATTVAEEAGIELTSASVLSKDQKDKVVALVTQSIMMGETVFSADAQAKYKTSEEVRKYTVGLVNNWFTKDTRLNGGSKYQPKNPGSRQGIADPQIKELNKLLQLHPEAKADIEAAIAARKAEINTAKAPTVNADLIPESLRDLLK